MRIRQGSQAADRRSHKRGALRFLTGPDDDVQNAIVERDRICIKLIAS